MKETLKKMLLSNADLLRKIHVEDKAYVEFKNYLKDNIEIKNQFSEQEINEIFPIPASFKFTIEVEENEDGAAFTSSEFTDSDSYSLQDLKEFGWLNDDELRKEILSNPFYKKVVLPSIGDMQIEVKNDIELHSTHILGRCNNPNDWGANRQGLVYGMVQSGKTASMMTLMGQAKASGYRIFIVLSGDKESLRNQTQKRINEAFNLNDLGNSRDSKNNVRCITQLRSDYTDVSKKINNGLDLWDIDDNNQTIIICIKKQKDNLGKLLQHLKDIELECMPDGRANNIDFGVDFKTMIIDDEADFASQDTTGNGTAIHDLLVKIREKLSQNCYVAYTATPQACIGANPEKLIGYPSDFIWLLDPYRTSNGETDTYLGLEEFFEKFPNQLIERLHKDAWPHILKDEGRRLGIYKPGQKELEVIRILTKVETEFVNDLIKNKTKREKYCQEYKLAIADYLIGCAIRWYRHYVKCKIEGYFSEKKPTLVEIEAVEARGKRLTAAGYKPFPYHAMMFNLTYINESQSTIIQLIDMFWKEIKEEWLLTKNNSWKKDSVFTSQIEKQIEKSMRFETSIPEASDLEEFIEIAIKITSTQIYGKDKSIYLLNSKDEGSTLQYDSQARENRPKKASIIVGGNILSRGLTIENLSVTVFARSQVMSLGDTNLQMCRWFGHKKRDIDIQTVYMQDHSQELFQSISVSDKELRSQFRYHIFNNIPNKCLLLSLFNSPLFRSTSPSKMRSRIQGEQSYSGITIDLLEHIKDPNYRENDRLLNEYLKKLDKKAKWKLEFKRAKVYRDVPHDDFMNFFKGLKIADDAMNISPDKYLKYLEKWLESKKGNLPKFNIAVFDVDHSGKLRKRARKVTGVASEFKSENELKENALKSLAAFRGGKSDSDAVKSDKNNSYCGDNLIDLPLEFHIKNYSKKNLRREKGLPILFLFYKISANYVGRFRVNKGKGIKATSKDVYFVKGDKLFIEDAEKTPLITFSISTPIGGPVYQTTINKKVAEIVEANNVECEAFLEKLNNSQNI